MTNYKFLREYLNLQNGIIYDQLLDLGFAAIGYCQKDPSPFWNLALVNQLLTDEQLTEIENQLQSLSRKPAVYFEDRKDLDALVSLLEKSGYLKINEDSWMFYDNPDIDQANFSSVKKVITPDDLRVFLETFDACYQKDDPQNPYGQLGEYLQVAEAAWLKFKNSNKLEYYMAYQDSLPVAVSTLTNYQDIGYISNVGSLRSVRGQGYGKAVTLYCVQESRNRDSKLQCLTTEEGSYPNEFYKRIGFTTKFTALIFTK